jgi:N-acyl homoserine lactone hydrolase
VGPVSPPAGLTAVRAAGVRGFSTGLVRGKRRSRGIRRYLPGGWSERPLPVNVFLVEHPDGLLLFDTGQTARAARPGHFPWWHPFFRLARFELEPGDEAAAQLAGLGFEPTSVRRVVLSHLHTDHAGGLPEFRRAEVLVSRAEWQCATDQRARLRGYLPQYLPAGLDPVLIDFAGPPLGPFGASHDITGDGSLVLVPTPGHTPGHMALIVYGGDGAALLAGDLAERGSDLAEQAADVDAWCRDEGIEILTSHDPRARG